MTQTTLLNYEAPWPVYALDWCKTPAPGQQHRPRSAFRLALASFTEDFRNRIAIVGLQDERVLVEDDYTDYPDFVTLVETNHGFPATSIQWQPSSSLSHAWSTKPHGSEFLVTTGDALRIWEYNNDAQPTLSSYVGKPPTGTGHRLTMKGCLSGTKIQVQNNANPPITNFSWNEKSPNLVVSSSIDTTCTVWNLDAQAAVTQLIAHDREVYDVAWLPNSTDIFVSVGADGSLRAFDLRSLEHSTILYETPTPKPNSANAVNAAAAGRPRTAPLLKIAFNPADSNYMATFHMESSDVQILDMRSPGQPVMELRGHRAQVNALGWGMGDQPLLATAADDCQVLLWDLNTQMATAHSTSDSQRRSGGSNRVTAASPRPDEKKKRILVTDPLLAYSTQSEINNLCWSPQIASMTMNTGHTTAPGEWVAVSMGKSVKALKV